MFKVTILIKNLQIRRFHFDHVDYFIGGEESVTKAFELLKKLCIRFLEGHFLLRKQKTNNLELRNLIIQHNLGKENTVNKVEKFLGIPWDSDKDKLFTILRLL